MAALPGPRATRADAVRNRRRVAEVATRAFQREGVSASVNAIADEAGVGIGTLYRHFPTKEDLIREVVRRRLDDLAEISAAVAGADGEPREAFVRWAAALVDHIASFAALQQAALHALSTDPVLSATQRRVFDDGATLLEASYAAAGHAAPPPVTDVATALAAVAGTATLADPERPMRLLDMLVNGLAPAGPRAM